MRPKSTVEALGRDDLLREQPTDCTLIGVDDMQLMLTLFGQLPIGAELAEMWWWPMDRTWNAVYKHPAVQVRDPGVPMGRQPEKLVLDMRVARHMASLGLIQINEGQTDDAT